MYYDGNTGCYYDYDKTANQFVFHSQAYAATEPSTDTADKAITDAVVTISNKKVAHPTPDCYRLSIYCTVLCV